MYLVEMNVRSPDLVDVKAGITAKFSENMTPRISIGSGRMHFYRGYDDIIKQKYIEYSAKLAKLQDEAVINTELRQQLAMLRLNKDSLPYKVFYSSYRKAQNRCHYLTDINQTDFSLMMTLHFSTKGRYKIQTKLKDKRTIPIVKRKKQKDPKNPKFARTLCVDMFLNIPANGTSCVHLINKANEKDCYDINFKWDGKYLDIDYYDIQKDMTFQQESYNIQDIAKLGSKNQKEMLETIDDLYRIYVL